ncbi:DUF188 domain-containing protein [uncultured Cloacibacillus sp.]|uniref:YaiI/YqxD family protein n=1 Tax=uncultured Cloacibacillus sp. TaxID=889794 RepID=UPI001F91F921|nr:DUF188 domain-containing protein [uncultured Cloacibacillus sp.]HIR18177.1 DUF188 domain-containing protein [Candidatus Caccocola faecigallinarum]
MKIIVDADACPRGALASAASLAERYGARLVTVAGFDHVIDSPEHVTVGDDPQEADIKIINLTRAGDAVVTQDIGLAAAVLGKKAAALHPCGFEYREETIAAALEEREIKAKYRRAGGRTKGPPKRTKEDDERFASRLEQILRRLAKDNAG